MAENLLKIFEEEKSNNRLLSKLVIELKEEIQPTRNKNTSFKQNIYQNNPNNINDISNIQTNLTAVNNNPNITANNNNPNVTSTSTEKNLLKKQKSHLTLLIVSFFPFYE